MQRACVFLGTESESEIRRALPDYRPLSRLGSFNYWINLKGEAITFPQGRVLIKARGDRYTVNLPPRYTPESRTVASLVAIAWCGEKEEVWKDSPYAEQIRETREFFKLRPDDKVKLQCSNIYGAQYWISRYGDVWEDRTYTRFHRTVPNSAGYINITLRTTSGPRNLKIHRLVAENFVPIPSALRIRGFTTDNLVVNHKDGNKLNNRWDNLEWCTQQHNADHARRHGLYKNTISNELLQYAFYLLSQGKTDIEISELTKIPAPTVNNIRRRVTKRYDTPDYTWPMYSASKEKMRERHCEVIDLYNQGLTYAEISKRLGTAQTHITTILNTYPELVTRQRRDNTAQNNGQRLDDTKLTRIFEALASGKSNLEIGQEYSIDPAKVANIRARRIYARQGMKYDWRPTKSINMKTRAETDRDYREIVDMLNQGASWKSICEKYRCDEGKIHAARRRYGYLLNQKNTTHEI